MKKLVTMLVAVALVLAVALPASANPFADVPQDHWAYEAIRVLTAAGVIEGFPDGTFKGDEPTTRYQMAMIVARLLYYLEDEITAEIEAVKAEIPKAPAATEAPATEAPKAEAPKTEAQSQTQVIERTVIEKPIVEKVIERIIEQKELDEATLAKIDAALAALEAKINEVQETANLGTTLNKEHIGALEGKVDTDSQKLDELNTKTFVNTDRLDAVEAKADANFALIQANKAGLDAQEAILTETAKRVDAIVDVIDALKIEFGKELEMLDVRVANLENELAAHAGRISALESDLAAFKNQVNTEFNRFKFTGTDTVTFEDVDVIGGPAYSDPFERSDEITGSNTFKNELALKLTINPDPGVVVKVGLDTYVDVFDNVNEGNAFEPYKLTLDITTSGAVGHLVFGDIVIPDGAFTTWTLDKTLYNDPDEDGVFTYPHEGGVAQFKYGKLDGTAIVGKKVPLDGNGEPTSEFEYLYAVDANYAFTDNLTVGGTAVKLADDDSASGSTGSFYETVYGFQGAFKLADGWDVSGEFAKYEDADAIVGNALTIAGNGKIGLLKLDGSFTRVEPGFIPYYSPYWVGDEDPDFKNAHIGANATIGALTLAGKYDIDGDADWAAEKYTTKYGEASYKLGFIGATITPKVSVENVENVIGTTTDSTTVTKGVDVALSPFTFGYKVTNVDYATGDDTVATELSLGAEYKIMENLTVKGSYLAYDKDTTAGVDSRDYTKATAGLDLSFGITKNTTGKAGLGYENIKFGHGFDYTGATYEDMQHRKVAVNTSLTSKLGALTTLDAYANVDSRKDTLYYYGGDVVGEYDGIYFNAGAKLTHNIAAHTSLTLSYDYKLVNYDEDVALYDDYRVKTIGLTLSTSF